MFIINIRIESKKSSLTKKEIWNLINYTYSVSVEEGLNPPLDTMILVLDSEAYNRYPKEDGIKGEHFFCRLHPPMLIIRGDISADSIAFNIIKLARVLAYYNTYNILDLEKAEEWARKHFMKALSFMVQ